MNIFLFNYFLPANIECGRPCYFQLVHVPLKYVDKPFFIAARCLCY